MGRFVLTEHVIGLDLGDRPVFLKIEKEIGRIVGMDMDPDFRAAAGDDSRFSCLLDQIPNGIGIDVLANKQGFCTEPLGDPGPCCVGGVYGRGDFKHQQGGHYQPLAGS